MGHNWDSIFAGESLPPREWLPLHVKKTPSCVLWDLLRCCKVPTYNLACHFQQQPGPSIQDILSLAVRLGRTCGQKAVASESEERVIK